MQLRIGDISSELNLENYNFRYILKEYLGRELKDTDLTLTIEEAQRVLNFILLSKKFRFVTIKGDRRYIDFEYEQNFTQKITDFIKKDILSSHNVKFDIFSTTRIQDIAKEIKNNIYSENDYLIELSFLCKDKNYNDVHYEKLFKYSDLLKIKNTTNFIV